jgi:radical SAM protein with 4Fe4S-binding SPASM domain
MNLFSTIEIEVNSACNKACSYCPNADFRRIEQGVMEPELFKLLLSQLVDLHYKGSFHYHFYNEPLLCPHLEHFIELSKSELPETRSKIYTNGSYLTLEKFRALVKAGVDRFIVTRHEEAGDFVFEETWRNLTDHEKTLVKYEQHEQLILTNRGGLLPVGKPLLGAPLTRPCLIPSMSLVVTVQGNVLVCYEDFFQQTAKGNIRDRHLKDIWSDQAYQQFRQDLKEGKREKYSVCRDCNNMQVVM